MKAFRLNQYRRMAQRQRVRAWHATKSRSKKTLEKALALPIMIVDDEPLLLSAAKLRLIRAGFRNIQTFSNPLEAIQAYKSLNIKPRIIITDLKMPEITGDQLISQIAEASKKRLPRFFIYSGNPAPAGKEDPITKIMARYKAYYIQKGYSPNEFMLAVLEAGKDILKGIKPDKPFVLAAKGIADGEFKNNPYMLFMRGIAHDMNNILGTFSFMDVFIYNIECNANIINSFHRLFEFVDSLPALAKSEKEATLVRTLLDNGLLAFTAELRTAFQDLELLGIDKRTVKIAFSRYRSAKEKYLDPLHDSVYLKSGSSTDFRILYQEFAATA